MPDARAWGRRDFHRTDQHYSSYNEREQELAEEETEARAIQQRFAKQLDESDFTLDVFNVPESVEESSKQKKSDTIVMQKDLSQLSKRQKEQLFRKDSPEFEGLVGDFKQRLDESIQLLQPILEYFKENSIEKHPLVEFIVNQNQLILNYCTNVSFYLVLKAKRVPITNHPIVKRLVKIRQLLLQIDEKYTSIVKPQIEELLAAIKDGREFTIETTKPEEKKTKKLRFIEALENGKNDSESDGESDTANAIDDENLDYEQKLKMLETGSDHENVEEEEEEADEDKRRAITYQIAKNKGLTPYRKKELRNPRVKNKLKYRKALIRRKGAVRGVYKQLKPYDGEKFGIKAGVKKGIKIK